MNTTCADNVSVRYGIPVLAVMLTIIAYVFLEGVVGGAVLTTAFLPAVLLSLFYGGVGPGLLGSILSSLALAAFAFSASGEGVDLTDSLRVGVAAAGFTMACVLMHAREKKVRSSMDALSMAVSSAVDGIVYFDKSGRIVSCDELFAQFVGSTQSALKDRPMLELIVPEDREALTRAARQCWREHKADVEARVLWRGAAPHDVHMMLARIDDAKGDPGGIYCFLKDISQRKKELEELRQHRERLRVAFQHGIVGMIVCNMEGKLLEVNPAFCELIGYQPDELIGKYVDTITHVNDRARDGVILRRLAGGEMDHCVTEKRYVSRSGQTIWVRVSREVVHDENGHPEYIVAQVQELSRGAIAATG